jgi:hypothetical protein
VWFLLKVINVFEEHCLYIHYQEDENLRNLAPVTFLFCYPVAYVHDVNIFLLTFHVRSRKTVRNWRGRFRMESDV